jgi:hypothetical protein
VTSMKMKNLGSASSLAVPTGDPNESMDFSMGSRQSRPSWR